MSRTKILAIILLFSLGFAVYTYWPQISSYFPKGEKEGPKTAAEEVEPEKAAEAATCEAETKNKSAVKPEKEKKLLDPLSLRVAVKTKAEVEAAKTEAEEKSKEKEEEKKKIMPLRLEGIWISPKMKIAFISGQALPLGGSVRGWTVTGIFSTRVVLVKDRENKILRLEGE